MNDRDFVTLLTELMKQIAYEVFKELSQGCTCQSHVTEDATAKLREQLALIKAKERVTVKEVALLLSCSESHIRKLVKLAVKGKSRRPIPYVNLEGVTVFPLLALLEWASPEQPQAIQDELVLQNKAA